MWAHLSKYMHIWRKLSLVLLAPQEGVIDTSDMVRKVLGDSIVPFIVAVTADHVPLWCYPVSVSAPLSKKGCVVAVVRVEGNLVVAIPSVHYTLFGVGRDLGCKLEWALDGEGLA